MGGSSTHLQVVGLSALQQGARQEQSCLRGLFFLQMQKKQQQPCQSTLCGGDFGGDCELWTQRLALVLKHMI